jgi:3-oxoacyl-[acyl-carrier protein] reductase
MTDSSRLVSKVAIITGAGQGIGRAIAGALAAEGATVVVADKNGGSAAAVAQDLAEKGLLATSIRVDVADQASVESMVTATVGAHGRIDILVNNAAIFSTIVMKPFDQIGLQEWNEVIGVNLTGVFLCCQAVGTQMLRQRQGRIVNISSAVVLAGRPYYPHYVASKAGVIGLTRALARELGSSEITVNAIMPGMVRTEIDRDSVTPEQAAAIVADQSLHRQLVPADIVGTALFLASDAAGSISGQSLVVDGGRHFA